ncbi:hypothetical protein V1477_001862 [Vespula maculifrons]|uniref:Uncharacterized protein n=1 Tax=Vespula maculifrons TaxID=7453 RepID=A0ABD2CXP2_VESMC
MGLNLRSQEISKGISLWEEKGREFADVRIEEEEEEEEEKEDGGGEKGGEVRNKGDRKVRTSGTDIIAVLVLKDKKTDNKLRYSDVFITRYIFQTSMLRNRDGCVLKETFLEKGSLRGSEDSMDHPRFTKVYPKRIREAAVEAEAEVESEAAACASLITNILWNNMKRSHGKRAFRTGVAPNERTNERSIDRSIDRTNDRSIFNFIKLHDFLAHFLLRNCWKKHRTSGEFKIGEEEQKRMWKRKRRRRRRRRRMRARRREDESKEEEEEEEEKEEESSKMFTKRERSECRGIKRCRGVGFGDDPSFSKFPPSCFVVTLLTPLHRVGVNASSILRQPDKT